jgi:CheY-like chemotaxis protein
VGITVVLVVDDDGAFRESLKEFLARHGYSVQCAANGSEALQLYKGLQAAPELILLDLIMPVLDGWGFLIERCKDPQLAKVPVVVISGSSGMDRKAKAAGAAAVMSKPVAPEALLEVVEHFATAARSTATI